MNEEEGLTTAKDLSLLPFYKSMDYQQSTSSHDVINNCTSNSSTCFVTSSEQTTVFPIESDEPWRIALIVLGCGFIIVGTILGNVLVCLAVGLVRKLRTPSNLLIVSLATSDLLVASLVMPLAALYEAQNRWTMGQFLCDVWTSLDVILCTSSILNLCAISIDRYLIITRPLRYAMKRTKLHMVCMITFVWMMSVLISIPPLFGWKDKSANIQHGGSVEQCVLSQAIGYQFYATIGAFYIPLVVMIVIYTRIYRVSARIARCEERSRPSNTIFNRRRSRVESPLILQGPGHRDSEAIMGRKELNGDAPNGRRKEGHRPDRPHSERPGTVERKRKIFDLLGPCCSGCLRSFRCTRCSYSESCCTGVSPSSPRRSSSYPASPRPTSYSIPRGSEQDSRYSAILQMPDSPPKRERKATKTLGVIMGAFIACWLPFFVVALVRPFVPGIPHLLTSFLQWLGFANSFLNPIIYARFNRDFRGPFKDIVMFRCRGLNNRQRSETYAELFGGQGAVSTPNRQRLSDPLNSRENKSSSLVCSELTPPVLKTESLMRKSELKSDSQNDKDKLSTQS